jgi:lauroyl/myristoyl acyltransferase
MGVGKTVYKGEVKTGVFAWFLHRTAVTPVGASMLAKKAGAPLTSWQPWSSLTFIASMLAPTGFLAPKLTQIDDI